MPIVNNYAGWTVRRAQADARADGLQLAITDGNTEHPPSPPEMPRQISQNDSSTPAGSDLPEGGSVLVWLEPATMLRTSDPHKEERERGRARP